MAPVASPQFGIPNQTDVFTVDKDGKLTVQWVSGTGNWHGPTAISSSVFPRDALLAAGEQFGAGNATDVIGIAKSGHITIAWVFGGEKWNGPLDILDSRYQPGSSVATSAQFGVKDQTDVFAVDKSGHLVVAWITGRGTWAGPTKIGDGYISGKTFVAASQRFGEDRTDVYAVNSSGALVVTSVKGKGSWEPHTISRPDTFVPGSALAAGPQYGLDDQTDVFGVDRHGALTVTWYDGNNWNGPRRITKDGVFPPGASVATAAQGDDQTDVFAVNQRGQVTVSWVTRDSDWDGPTAISEEGFAEPGARLAAHPQLGAKGQLDVFVQDKHSRLNVLWVTEKGDWSGPKAV